MRTAFLTGATGFLGGHVVRALIAEGWSVRALARDPARARGAASDGAQILVGDLSGGTDLAAACEGCEAIVHVAGLVKARTLEEYRLVNVAGTQRLSRAAGVSAPDAFFLLVSSQAAAGPARDGRPVSESDPARPVSWYGLSKHEGEEAVARLWPGPWTIIRPGVIYGPGDRGLLVLFRAAARGLVPVPGGARRIQVIAAQDAARAIALAAGRRDLAGRRGFLCDPSAVAMSRLCFLIARLPSRPARQIRLPDLAVRAAGLAETLLEVMTRRSLPFNADKAREMLAGDWICDPAPLRAALRLPPSTPLEDGLRQTWNWYVDCGWLRL